MKYKDVLDIEWALQCAETRAKSDWDDMVIYKDTGSCLYGLAYDRVKQLRAAQKKLRGMYDVIKRSDIDIEYSA